MKSCFNGIIKREGDNYKVYELPETVGLYNSLLQVPLCVLHPKSAEKINILERKWHKKDSKNNIVTTYKFSFRRDSETPFPTPTHLKYLDILISMFCQNWNDDGVLHFRYVDVLKIAGVVNSSGSRDAIKQTIKRYMRHSTEWEDCWAKGVNTVNFNLIVGSSILDEDGEIKEGKRAKNSRGSMNKSKWHSVVFNSHLVKALDKEKKNRLFLSEHFATLPTDSFYVYRFFRSNVDENLSEKYRKAGWIGLDSLKSIFKWTGQQSRFEKWIDDRINTLVQLGLIHSWERNKDNGAMRVICKEPKNEGTQNIETEEQGTFDLNNCTDEALVAAYYEYRGKDLIPKDQCGAIDMLLDLPSMKSVALKGIRNAIEFIHTKEMKSATKDPGLIKGEHPMFRF